MFFHIVNQISYSRLNTPYVDGFYLNVLACGKGFGLNGNLST